MDIDDDRPKPGNPLDLLEREDLELLSREELAERAERLAAERTRTLAMLERKGATQSVAESLFRKG
ncbi:MAG: DUF1192 family protein [Alphaproteobacteria bacterium]|nr:MAG: DUF1192 family protein [Alphaproteobacteria bacterium]